MRFDDRLMTVLDQPATDPHDRAVRWRQLVDLVARSGAQSGNPLVEQALKLIRSDRKHVDENLRAAAARAIASLPLPFELVALFASDSLAVSAPVLAAARLDTAERRQLIDLADPETRNFIETLHPDGSTEQAPAHPKPTSTTEKPLMQRQEDQPRDTRIPSISDVVARIERLRRSRGQAPALPAMTGELLRPTTSPGLFRWECGPSGEIAWVEGAPRGALVGRSIARAEDGEGVDEEVERAFAMRSPFHDGHLSLSGDGVLAGEWKISGVPAFEPTSGRFAGYRGIALREGTAPTVGATSFAPADPDSLRELVHEIKTPLNAIIGFAEIIDGQYLGPADRNYRTRAAEIVAQAKLLLSAIDDLDFAAKLQADRDRPGGGTDLAVLLEQIAAGMRAAGGDGPQLELAIATKRTRCALEPALAERLVTRFCDAAVSAAPAASRLLLHLDNGPGRCLLWVAEAGRSAKGVDLNFGLRLVRGLARIAVGDLTTAKRRISLELPEL